ncbi:YybS family protein [Ectobacillus ponti]|uniref:YybS family protein n=1 Tax=Ectobacillus ponti TaxID=2961894 RepID=A0AA41XE41_9BACI|nr:YybS family protein [Ectobacillus ponti]MCP8971228.1 YybS family protein [Ectobacillus ponti]
MRNARRLTEGAVLLAIYAVLLLSSMYIPLLGLLTTFVLPLPFIIFTMRHHIRYTAVLLVAASGVTFILSSPLNIINTILSGLTGIVIGWMYQRGKGQVETFLASTVVILLNFVVLYVVSVKFLEFDMLQQLRTTMEESLQQAEKFAKLTGSANTQSIDQFRKVMDTVQYLLPAMFVMGAAMLAFVTQAVTVPILKKLRLSVPPWPPFRDIQLPRHLLLLYIVILLVSIFVRPAEKSFLYMALLNANIIFQFLTALHGLAFLAYFAHVRGYPKAVPIVAGILGFLIPILFSIYSFLGIIDLGFSLRRLLKRA